MNAFEKVCTAIRHLPVLERFTGLWRVVGPLYTTTLRSANGAIERNFNGTDRLRLDPLWRNISTDYESKVWQAIVGSIRPGDTVADVGAFVGLYSLAMAKRLEGLGEVHSFEPDVFNHSYLLQHIHLNSLGDRIIPHQAAVGANCEPLSFRANNRMESAVVSSTSAAGEIVVVEGTTLDAYFGEKRLDVVKIDVEGHELAVLKGAQRTLGRMADRPRLLFMELHPHLWEDCDAMASDLKQHIVDFGYAAKSLMDDAPVDFKKYQMIMCVDARPPVS